MERMKNPMIFKIFMVLTFMQLGIQSISKINLIFNRNGRRSANVG